MDSIEKNQDALISQAPVDIDIVASVDIVENVLQDKFHDYCINGSGNPEVIALNDIDINDYTPIHELYSEGVLDME